jgi:NADH dehydrogenase FAD-containing subunit
VVHSCQRAVPQGKFVGQNVAAVLLGLKPVPFALDPYVTCLDLGSYGAVLTVGWDRDVQLTKQAATTDGLTRRIHSDLMPYGEHRFDPRPVRRPRPGRFRPLRCTGRGKPRRGPLPNAA